MLLMLDGALRVQRATDTRPPPNKNADATFGLYRKQDGQLSMGNKVVRLDVNEKTLTVGDTYYTLTPDLLVLITQKYPRPIQYNSSAYIVYKSLVAQSKVKSFPNRTDAARPHATWKWKHMLKKMTIPGEGITEEEPG